MIIAVDFDGTLMINKQPNHGLIAMLQDRQMRGDIVILWTCRERESLCEAVRFLAANGFRPNYINQNAPQGIKQLGHDSRKVFADLYIDDKNIMR